MKAALLLVLVPFQAAGEHRPQAPTLKEALAELAGAHEATDAARARRLFERAPQHAALVVAADLEAGLALQGAREGGERAERLLERARWAGRAAGEAGLPAVGEWAAAIGELDVDGLRLYRQGQALYVNSLEEAARGEETRALDFARSAADHALSVGDWWGAALALRQRGEREQAASAFEDALVSYSRARRLHAALGQLEDELELCLAAARTADTLGRGRRALELARQAGRLRERAAELGIARGTDASEGLELLRLRASLEKRLGLVEEAAASERALESATER